MKNAIDILIDKIKEKKNKQNDNYRSFFIYAIITVFWLWSKALEAAGLKS